MNERSVRFLRPAAGVQATDGRRLDMTEEEPVEDDDFNKPCSLNSDMATFGFDAEAELVYFNGCWIVMTETVDDQGAWRHVREDGMNFEFVAGLSNGDADAICFVKPKRWF